VHGLRVGVILNDSWRVTDVGVFVCMGSYPLSFFLI